MNTYIPTATKTRAIKKALAAHFPAKDISVTKGTGTASHWISTRVTVSRPAECNCEVVGRYPACFSCRNYVNRIDKYVESIASKALTDLGANFDTYYSDDYTDSTPRSCHSVSINFH
jgi:hypothetical protein